MMIAPTYLIIGGTNKAGTTSVFSYLSAHPQVCGSNVKETGFFINEYVGNPVTDKEAFDVYFRHCRGKPMVQVEASTGYLAQAEIVAERIEKLLGSPKILFILRSPADRLYSYFNFHLAQLSLPSSLSFDDYLRLSFDYESGKLLGSEAPFNSNYLKALGQGNYSTYLERFISVFGMNQLKLMLFEELAASPKLFMRVLSQFIGIDPDFYEFFGFERSNRTFSSRNAILHRFALFTNNKLEPLLRQRPILNNFLKASYRRLNTSKEGYGEMSSWARQSLYKYYVPDTIKVESILGRQLPDNWYDR